MRKAILILLAMVAVASADPWAARLGEWAALQQRRAVVVPEPTEPPYWEIEVTTTTSPQTYGWNINAGTGIDIDVDYGGITNINYTTTGDKTFSFPTAGVYYVRFSGGAASGLNIRLGGGGARTPRLVTATKAIGGVSGIANFRQTFTSTSITQVPADLFRWNPQVSVNAFFATFASSYLQSFPADLFRYNTNVSSGAFQELNYNNFETTTLPPDLFRYNTNATSYAGAFFRNRKLQMRDDLWGPDLQSHFDGRTVNWQVFFIQNVAYEGAAPGIAPALWSVTNVTFQNPSDVFTGNSTNSLTNWEQIPTTWGGPLAP